MKVDLYLGDCLELLPNIPDQSVEAIITDLPYGTTACKWDEVIPFAPMWEQVKRVLKPRGVFVTTASQPFTSKLVMSNLEWFKYEWVWEKNKVGAVSHAKNAPLKMHENVLVFSGGSVAHSGVENRMPYNPQGLKKFGETKKQVIGRSFNSKGARPSDKPTYIQEFTGYPLSVLTCDNETDLDHPTQKPVALYKYLILTYTNPGDTVLDFTAGSGTTGVAAVETGRNAILIEKDPGYFEIVQRRIKQAQAQPNLFEGIT
jgi:site-specific DNA-methyltransferase (adenine-specific)